jgi:hypothetical protein
MKYKKVLSRITEHCIVFLRRFSLWLKNTKLTHVSYIPMGLHIYQYIKISVL